MDAELRRYLHVVIALLALNLVVSAGNYLGLDPARLIPVFVVAVLVAVLALPVKILAGKVDN